jgi:hypothetical protein
MPPPRPDKWAGFARGEKRKSDTIYVIGEIYVFLSQKNLELHRGFIDQTPSDTRPLRNGHRAVEQVSDITEERQDQCNDKDRG